eukprot:TRINITY_DN6707_c0_g2_i1.p1 TRINITY_DN6707_c0_g2~~TRINITY_DN6707_c0_g2_i1.p1  ORF type:complete len:112 (-),score=29.63 TRINITY_DN6707_c0_g2_i1:180-515(-)
MADRQDWWGYLVFGFFIILFVMFLIKIFIEFPGLLEWRFVFSDDDTGREDRDVERNEILEEISTHTTTKTGPKKCVKVKAAADERKNVEDAEILPQSAVARHALLSNFMSS